MAKTIEWYKSSFGEDPRCFADTPPGPPYGECERIKGHSGPHMERPRPLIKRWSIEWIDHRSGLSNHLEVNMTTEQATELIEDLQARGDYVYSNVWEPLTYWAARQSLGLDNG